MNELQIFQMALGLTAPWYVESVEFSSEQRRLDMNLDYKRGTKFKCPECGQSDCRTYDSEIKTWRHLNFFQHETYIHARVPRCDCSTCGPRVIPVPWSRPDSGFTLLFEMYIMTLVQEMPVKAISEMVNEHDTRLWRIIHHYVEEARSLEDFSGVTNVAVDETSRCRGHQYITIFAEANSGKVLYAVEGKNATTIKKFKEDFQQHKGDPASVTEFSSDMSRAFVAGIEKQFPHAHITFDKFHVMKLINEAVDMVRRNEQKARPELKSSRYVWLKNQSRLSAYETEILKNLSKGNLKTARAYRMKLVFQEFWQQPSELAEAFLKKWYFWATHSRLEPMKNVAETLKDHWNGILRWFVSRINNGRLEGINSMIQAVKRRARGYRTVKNFIAMIYILRSQLKIPTLVGC